MSTNASVLSGWAIVKAKVVSFLRHIRKSFGVNELQELVELTSPFAWRQT